MSPLRRGEYIRGALVLIAALIANYHAGMYVDRVGRHLPALKEDLLLSVLPRWDLTFLFVWGFTAFLAFAVTTALIYERKHLPYIAWMYGILILIRAFFLILTPMGAPAEGFPIQGYPIFDMFGNYLTFNNDLFFSAHTSMPFLGFLIYHKPWVRAVFFGMSVVLAATVLISRLHYSIDVAAAYFITCGVVWTHRALIEPPYFKWRERQKRGLK